MMQASRRRNRFAVLAMGAACAAIVVGCSSRASTRESGATLPMAAAPIGAGTSTGVDWARIALPGGGALSAAVARPVGAGPHPVLVILHGTHGFAREYVGLARDLAREAGVVAIAACWFAGRRGAGVELVTPIECPEAPPMPSTGMTPEALDVVDAVVNAARALPGVRADRVALLGHSRGRGRGALRTRARQRQTRRRTGTSRRRAQLRSLSARANGSRRGLERTGASASRYSGRPRRGWVGNDHGCASARVRSNARRGAEARGGRVFRGRAPLCALLQCRPTRAQRTAGGRLPEAADLGVVSLLASRAPHLTSGRADLILSEASRCPRFVFHAEQWTRRSTSSTGGLTIVAAGKRSKDLRSLTRTR